MRDELKRLRATELAVVDDPTAKFLPSPAGGGSARQARRGGVLPRSKAHKPNLDEMGIALYHEVAPHRDGANKRQEAASAGGATGTRRSGPRKPTLDEMGPGVESIPGDRTGPRSTLGRPGMRGGFKPRRR
jgi:excinuclease ABC subunit B